ncbi:transposase [Streptomyces sp. NPDC059165]|uniref:transposase n=1 Tax=Streptomyces sp. NPDC059165 TaxID=3346751 RepID=UPI0036756A76
MGRGDLTDEQWAVLEPLLPKGARSGRPPVWPRRRLIDGIRFRVRTGVPWRDVPVEQGPWGRVCDLFAGGSGTGPGSGSSPGSSLWPTRRARSSGT